MAVTKPNKTPGTAIEKQKSAEKETAPGIVSQHQIDIWREKNPLGVFKIQTEGHIGYITRPGRQLISMARSQYSDDEVKLHEILFKNIWLGGDEEILNNDRLFLGLMLSPQLEAIMRYPEYEVKEV